jgi:diacylglycerol kinase
MPLKSLRNSSRGLTKIAVEKMFLVELACGSVVVAFTWWWPTFTMFERLVVLTLVFLVLCLEGFNSAMEKLLDLIEPRHNKKVGVIKDMLGGAVLIGIVGALMVGVLIVLKVFRIII